MKPVKRETRSGATTLRFNDIFLLRLRATSLILNKTQTEILEEAFLLYLQQKGIAERIDKVIGEVLQGGK
jgi:hypothetical protein